jgi:hypothetical protein
MKRSLAGRVTSPDDENMVPNAQFRFARAAAVKHSGSGKPVFILQAETAVIDSGGAKRSARNDPRTVFEIPDAPARQELGADTFSKQKDFGAESFRLFVGTPCKLSSADAIREPEVVFDFGTAPGLSPDRQALDNDGLQSFRRRVYRRA